MIQFDSVKFLSDAIIWLTENMSHSLTRQVADEGAEEGTNEGVGEEGHVMERVGGVQQIGNCRDQIG